MGELDFDPQALADQASKLESEALDMQTRMHASESRLFEVQRNKSDKQGSSTRDADEARMAQERRNLIASRLASLETDVKRQLSDLQPMIQENHAGWQRLLSQQKKLDADRALLTKRIEEANRASDS